MSSDPSTLLTEKEYLAIERQAEFRSEFYNGEHRLFIRLRAGSLEGSEDRTLREAGGW